MPSSSMPGDGRRPAPGAHHGRRQPDVRGERRRASHARRCPALLRPATGEWSSSSGARRRSVCPHSACRRRPSQTALSRSSPHGWTCSAAVRRRTPRCPRRRLPRQAQRRQKPHRVRPLVAARVRSRGGQIHYAVPTGGKDGVGLPGQPGVVGRVRGDRDPLARGKPGDLNRDGLVRQRHRRAGGDLRMPRRAAAATPGQRRAQHDRAQGHRRAPHHRDAPAAAQHGEAEGAKAWTRSRTSSSRERGAFPGSASPTLVRQPLALRLRRLVRQPHPQCPGHHPCSRQQPAQHA